MPKTPAAKRPTQKAAKKPVATVEPTPTQRLVLQGMNQLSLDLGRTPTTHELADALGYADHTGVIQPLRQLSRRGLIDYTPRYFVEAQFSVTAAGKRWL